MIRYKLYSYPGYPDKLTSEHQPDMRPHGKRKYKLMHDYAISLITNEMEVFLLKIPDGFICDLASIPRIAWTASGLTPDGLLRAAALFHDWPYRHKGKIEVFRLATRIKIETTRVDADKAFYDLMRAAGVSFYRANLAYYFVRMFGPRWK